MNTNAEVVRGVLLPLLFVYSSCAWCLLCIHAHSSFSTPPLSLRCIFGFEISFEMSSEINFWVRGIPRNRSRGEKYQGGRKLKMDLFLENSCRVKIFSSLFSCYLKFVVDRQKHAVKNNRVYKSTSLTSFKSFILYSQTKQNGKNLSASIKYSPDCRALITEHLQSDVFLPNTNEQSDYIVSTMDLLYWNYNGNHIFFHL